MKKSPAQTFFDIPTNLDYEALRSKLKLKALKERKKFIDNFPEAHKFISRSGVNLGKMREHSAKVVGTGALVGSLLFGPGDATGVFPTPSEISEKFKEKILGQEDGSGASAFIVDTLKNLLPERPRPLTLTEEKFLEEVFRNAYKTPAVASLEGEHLNTTYGYIGAEQHLRRYPEDQLVQHGASDVIKEGMAPGLGAWGYFANSKNELTDDLVDKERWYAVVQTLYLPDWSARQPYLKNWYKYRKVMIVNTLNGKAVVAAIADSGPAAWTGKHYGGSPEVMQYLGGDRYKKGPVIVFFVDDPHNQIPLGPVSTEETANLVSLSQM